MTSATALPSNVIVQTPNGSTQVNASGPAAEHRRLAVGALDGPAAPVVAQSIHPAVGERDVDLDARGPPSSTRPPRCRRAAGRPGRGRQRPRSSPNPASRGRPAVRRTCTRAPGRFRRSNRLPCARSPFSVRDPALRVVDVVGEQRPDRSRSSPNASGSACVCGSRFSAFSRPPAAACPPRTRRSPVRRATRTAGAPRRSGRPAWRGSRCRRTGGRRRRRGTSPPGPCRATSARR